LFEEERSRAWVWILVAVALILFLGLPTYYRGRAQKEHERRLQLLKEGDEVVTASGLCGKLVKMEGDFAILEIAPGVRVRLLKDSLLGREEEVLLELRGRRGR